MALVVVVVATMPTSNNQSASVASHLTDARADKEDECQSGELNLLGERAKQKHYHFGQLSKSHDG